MLRFFLHWFGLILVLVSTLGVSRNCKEGAGELNYDTLLYGSGSGVVFLFFWFR